MSAFLIVRVEDIADARLLAHHIKYKFLAFREYTIGDVEDIQLTVDTLIENMDTITVLVEKEQE